MPLPRQSVTPEARIARNASTSVGGICWLWSALGLLAASDAGLA
jgi:hypothetical protein